MKSHDIEAKVFERSPYSLNRSGFGALDGVVSARDELKLLLIIAAFLVTMANSVWAQLTPNAKGCVIYKEQSWYKDSDAVMAEYRSYAAFPAIINVEPVRGNLLRLLYAQDPVFIQYPNDSKSSFDQVKPVLETAVKRFPQLGRKLGLITAAWVAKQAIAVPSTSVPRQDKLLPLKTKSGQTYKEWRITGIEGANEVLNHADGLTRIPLSEFPDDLSQYPRDAIAPIQTIRDEAAARRQAEFEKKARETEALKAAEVEKMNHAKTESLLREREAQQRSDLERINREAEAKERAEAERLNRAAETVRLAEAERMAQQEAAQARLDAAARETEQKQKQEAERSAAYLSLGFGVLILLLGGAGFVFLIRKLRVLLPRAWTAIEGLISRSRTKGNTAVSVQQQEDSIPVPSLKSRMVPLTVCILGFGWILSNVMPGRVLGRHAIVPVLLLAIPAIYFALISAHYLLRPKFFPLGKALAALLFTMIAGLALLLAFQRVAIWAADTRMPLRGYLRGEGTLWYMGLQFLGWAYYSTSTATGWSQFAGFIFAVGPCEEFTKLLPLFFWVLVDRKVPLADRISCQGFLTVAFFSGLGFGIGEAIHNYAPWTGEIYVGSNVLRWFACVSSHAVYTVIAAACLWPLAPLIQAESNKNKIFGWCVLATVITALIHGIYDVVGNFGPLMGPLMDVVSLLLLYHAVRIVQMWTDENVNRQEALVSLPSSNWLARRALDYETGRKSLIGLYAACAVVIFLVFFTASTPGGNIERDRRTSKAEAFPLSFVAAINQCHQAYQQSAGIEYPRMRVALQRNDVNVLLIALGDMMQRDYEKPVSSSLNALKTAQEQLQQQRAAPALLRESLTRYTEIIERNAEMFQTTEPMHVLEHWFNAYPDEDKIFNELIKGAMMVP